MAREEHGVRVGAQGRGVIPAALRKSPQLKPSDRLLARAEGESLVPERREIVEKRLRERFRHVPTNGSLAEEFIAERRTKARREANDT